MGNGPMYLGLSFPLVPKRTTPLGESERVLRNKTMKYVKILWSHQSEREATWELESRMRELYPDLFTSGVYSLLLSFQFQFPLV